MSDIITFSETLKATSDPATIEEAPEIIQKLEKALSKHKNGIGLSAIQIGIPKQIFVIAIEGDKGVEKFEHFINPEVIEAEDQFTFANEGCLSYPGLYLNTKRYRHYTLKRHILDGDELKEETDYFYYYPEEDNRNSNLISIAVQHEMDHLSGLVLPDYGFKLTIGPIRNTGAKVGRNDPCPCGSSKKFKKCCLGNGKYD